MCQILSKRHTTGYVKNARNFEKIEPIDWMKLKKLKSSQVEKKRLRKNKKETNLWSIISQCPIKDSRKPSESKCTTFRKDILPHFRYDATSSNFILWHLFNITLEHLTKDIQFMICLAFIQLYIQKSNANFY